MGLDFNWHVYCIIIEVKGGVVMKKKNSRKIGNRCGYPERNIFTICMFALILIMAQDAVFAESRTIDVVNATIKKVDNGTLDGSELNASYAGLYRSVEEINLIYITVVTNLQNRMKFIRIQNMQYQGRITGLGKESEKLRAEFERICRKEKAVSCNLNAVKNEYKTVKDELSCKIDALNSEIKKLNKELQNKENDLSLLKKDLEKMTACRNLLLKENDEAKADLAGYKNLTGELKGKNADLSNRLFQECNKTIELARQNSAMAENVKGYRNLVEKLENDNSNLSGDLTREMNKTTELTRQINVISENLKGYRSLVEKLEKDNSNLSFGLTREQERTAELTRQNNVNTENLKEYRNLVEKLEKDKVNLSADLIQQKNKIADLMKQNQLSAEELKKCRTTIRELDGRNSELSDKLSREQDKSSELSKLNQISFEDLQKYKDMVNDLRNRNLGLSNNLIAEQSKADQVAKKLDESKSTYDNLINELQQEIENGKVTVNRIKDKLTVNLIDKILFNSGSIIINDEGLVVLRKIANVLVKINNRRIQIEGHTDNVPITSSLKEKFPTNWELASLRAVTVVRYLTETCGLNPEYISAAGYSEYKPVDSNETSEGRYNNRRIEIILTPLERVVEQLQ